MARARLCGGELLILGLGEVLVRRAVAVARERNPLARRALAGGRATPRRRAADRCVTLERVRRDELLRGLDVAVYDAVHVRLRRHREVAADVPEQRARGTR